MRFLRLALISCSGWASVPAGKTLHVVYGGVTIEAQHVTQNREEKPDWILVIGSVSLESPPPINAQGEVLIEDAVRERIEEAIGLFADLVAVAHRSARSISSPLPYAALTDLTAEDREYLEPAVGFERRKLAVRNRVVEPIALDNPGLLELVADRPDGFHLMAEGLSSSHETGQFHEYIRVFERGFGLSPFELIDPLTAFLAAVPALGYERPEIERWLRDLRPSAAC